MTRGSAWYSGIGSISSSTWNFCRGSFLSGLWMSGAIPVFIQCFTKLVHPKYPSEAVKFPWFFLGSCAKFTFCSCARWLVGLTWSSISRKAPCMVYTLRLPSWGQDPLHKLHYLRILLVYSTSQMALRIRSFGGLSKYFCQVVFFNWLFLSLLWLINL